MATQHRRTSVDQALERIDPSNGAYITVTADAARARARTSPRGPLHGLTLAVKDIFNTAGVRTTYGSAAFADHVPSSTAAEVRRLQDLGAIMIGKTNLDEFAASMTGHNPHFGTMRIPGTQDRTPAGSSGGSAVAVAEGSADIGLGSDTGGSVRVPAVLCGLFGYKNARDERRVAGSMQLAPSFDAAGYIVRDLTILAPILGVTATPPLSSLQVRETGDLQLPTTPDEVMWVQFAREVAHTHGRQSQLLGAQYGELARRLIRDAVQMTANKEPCVNSPGGSSKSDASAQRANTCLPNDRRPPAIVDASHRPSTPELVALRHWAEAVAESLRDVDVIVAPVVPAQAPTVAEALAEHAHGPSKAFERYLDEAAWVNALGWPALAMPTSAGPRQIIARPGHDAAILAAARSMSEER